MGSDPHPVDGGGAMAESGDGGFISGFAREIDIESIEKKNVIIEFLHEPPQVKTSKSSNSKRSTIIYKRKKQARKII
jgi:hypothetical protein